MLSVVCSRLQSTTGLQISRKEKLESSPLFDSYIIVANRELFILKINLSPDLPNFWKELATHNFDFHPQIVACSDDKDEFKFMCYQMPKGIFASDISKYLLSPKLRLESKFAKTLKKVHSTKIGGEDQTVETFESFLPKETMIVSKTFPLAEIFASAKIVFKSLYKSNPQDCGLCHFDLDAKNIVYTGDDFKLLNFEYAANANIYLDLLLAKETLNASDYSFDNFLSFYNVSKQNFRPYYEASDLFIFAYLNSKIVSEYMTFGVSDAPKLKLFINKSANYYEKVADKLLISKTLDKRIKTFYHLWK